jgi:hypothetical protein
MTHHTFEQALRFCRRYEPRPSLVLLSGGEPTEHPRFYDMVRQAGRELKRCVIIVASNGRWLDDDRVRDRYLDLGVMFQVTNDPRFYPRPIRIVYHPNLKYEHRIGSVAPQGRAARNNIEGTRQSPGCFNLRSANLKLRFGKAIQLLRTQRKFCTPAIEPDGSVTAGESTDCQRIGNVWDDEQTLTRGLYRHCWCRLVDQLPDDLQVLFRAARPEPERHIVRAEMLG